MTRKTIVIPLQLQKLLEILCDEVKAILNEKFLALYVLGSVAMGDFSEHCSDIDFLSLVTVSLSCVEVKRLQSMHNKLREIRFGDRLEGEYLRTSALCSEGAKGTVARCEEGVLQPDVQSELSAENILDIRQNAIVLYGPKPKTIMPCVSRKSVDNVMNNYLKELNDELKHREPKDLKWLSSEVLNTCRALYTLKNGKITSKSVGARWALRVLSPEWKHLIRRSLAVRQGNNKENDETFIAASLPRFIIYALGFSDSIKPAEKAE